MILSQKRITKALISLRAIVVCKFPKTGFLTLRPIYPADFVAYWDQFSLLDKPSVLTEAVPWHVSCEPYCAEMAAGNVGREIPDQHLHILKWIGVYR